MPASAQSARAAGGQAGQRRVLPSEATAAGRDVRPSTGRCRSGSSQRSARARLSSCRPRPARPVRPPTARPCPGRQRRRGRCRSWTTRSRARAGLWRRARPRAAPRRAPRAASAGSGRARARRRRSSWPRRRRRATSAGRSRAARAREGTGARAAGARTSRSPRRRRLRMRTTRTPGRTTAGGPVDGKGERTRKSSVRLSLGSCSCGSTLLEGGPERERTKEARAAPRPGRRSRATRPLRAARSSRCGPLRRAAFWRMGGWQGERGRGWSLGGRGCLVVKGERLRAGGMDVASEGVQKSCAAARRRPALVETTGPLLVHVVSSRCVCLPPCFESWGGRTSF